MTLEHAIFLPAIAMVVLWVMWGIFAVKLLTA
jgi:hypothetical protein